MLLPSVQHASVPAFSAVDSSICRREPIRHMIFGSPGAVRGAVRDLHSRGYAKLDDWSRPVVANSANSDSVSEVMVVLSKRICF